MIFAQDNDLGRRSTDFQQFSTEFEIVSSSFTTEFVKAPEAI